MMTKENNNEVNLAFWLKHPDPTQAAVHLALQWCAFVYPASELQIDRTLKSALPYADTDLSSRWAQFLDEQEVEHHVEALEWLANTLSDEQIPFLVETCWRLLLVDHELPTHVPLALRILGRVLRIDEAEVQQIGENVFREFIEDGGSDNRAPLLPVDPRYLDRVEWRLYGTNMPRRNNFEPNEKSKEDKSSSMLAFFSGSIVGATVVLFLIFGPFQLGRLKVPLMTHDSFTSNEMATESNRSGDSNSGVVNETGSDIDIENVDANVAEAANTLLDSTEAVASPEIVSEVIVEAVEQPKEESTKQPTEQPTAQKESPRVLMYVTASLLNVRTEASPDSEIIIKLAGGNRVWAHPENSVGLWMQVSVEGQTGYASARFLKNVE